MFDGVHAGHRLLLDTLRRTAAADGLEATVFTFAGHPAAVLRPDSLPPALLTREQRVEQLRASGVDNVVTLQFTPELARLTAAEFIALLKKDYHVSHLVLGYDTKMGSDRVSEPRHFKAICEPLGIKVACAPQLVLDGMAVSSSAIRRALAEGEVALAAKLLGRPYALTGDVVQGNKNGTKIGFPTANMSLPDSLAIPRNGVYAAWAAVDGMKHPAVANIGVRPTLHDGRGLTIESHLIEFEGDLYGKKLKVEFVERLRDERRFDSLDELARQLSADVSNAIDALKTRPTSS